MLLKQCRFEHFMERSSCREFILKSLRCALQTPARLIHFLLHPYIANTLTNDPVNRLHTWLCRLLHECIQLSAWPHKLHGHAGQLGGDKQSSLLVFILLLRFGIFSAACSCIVQLAERLQCQRANEANRH